MKTFLLLCSLLTTLLAQPAERNELLQHIDSLLMLPKTAILLREDGTPFGSFQLIGRSLFVDTFYILIPDSALVGSRMAHDEAIVKYRNSLDNARQKFLNAPDKKKK